MPDGRLDAMAGELTATGDYRVLRRLVPRRVINEPDGTETHLGVVIDVETTGLDHGHDEIIELAMVPFTFSPDGRVFELRQPFHAMRQPSIPITPEITALTGLDEAAVAGHSIDPAAVAAAIDGAVLIVSHHAGFDRPFAERLFPVFRDLCWACSMSEIDWRAEGIESTKLAWLLSEFGIFYERHRASHDCFAVIELLTQQLLKSGVTAMKALLDRARQPSWRIWAEQSPFEMKDKLKARGYRWSPGDDGRPKSWFCEVADEQREAEIEWLRNVCYRYPDASPSVEKLTAYTRFAAGCG